MRLLYVARHAEADGSGLTMRGRRQAELLGDRLRDARLDAIHHGPLPRAAQTAALVAGQLDGVLCAAVEEAGDFVPYAPPRSELPTYSADLLLGFLASQPAADRALAAAALARFTGPVDGERRELVITHAFLVGWFLRDALDAPPWRWLGTNAANAALTVIRYAPGRPPELLMFNDTGHLA